MAAWSLLLACWAEQPVRQGLTGLFALLVSKK
jgi:hypothetical protein